MNFLEKTRKYLTENKIEVFFLSLIVFVSLFLYARYLNLYFSQDDFFHIRISQTDGSISQFLNLIKFRNFSERGGIYFFRPIFREVLYNIFYRLFGLNPFPYRLLQLVVHFINIVLTYVLVKKLTHKRTASLVAALFFGTASVNVSILSFLAGGIQNSGMLLFALTSLISYVTYVQKDKVKYKVVSFLFFLLALSSHEISITIPIVNIGISLWFNGFSLKNFQKALKDNVIYLLLVFMLLFLEVALIGLPTEEKQYGINFSPSRLLNSYFWYFAWSIGIPEMLVDFVGPGLGINPNLMKYWGSSFLIIFPSIFLIALIYLKNIILLLKSKTFLLLLAWSLFGITPIVFLPFHRQSYYLAFVLPAIAGVVGLTFQTIYEKNKSLAYSFLVLLFSLNFTSLILTDSTYWAVNRGKIAKKLILELKTKYPNLPKGAKIYFKNAANQPYFNEDWGHSSKQAYIAFSGNEALRLVYNDETLEVYYEDIKTPKVTEKVFPIEAVIY